jgi:hypothetical protein
MFHVSKDLTTFNLVRYGGGGARGGLNWKSLDESDIGELELQCHKKHKMDTLCH